MTAVYLNTPGHGSFRERHSESTNVRISSGASTITSLGVHPASGSAAELETGLLLLRFGCACGCHLSRTAALVDRACCIVNVVSVHAPSADVRCRPPSETCVSTGVCTSTFCSRTAYSGDVREALVLWRTNRSSHTCGGSGSIGANQAVGGEVAPLA